MSNLLSKTAVCGILAFAYLQMPAQEPRKIEYRKDATMREWKSASTLSLDRLKGFKMRKADPAVDKYGGWKVSGTFEACGFFRTEQRNGRWWLVDPEGNPFIFKGVAVFSVGRSRRQQEVFSEKYGTARAWADEGMDQLRSLGFNGLGAWSAVDDVRGSGSPMPYTVIVSPMGRYHSVHLKRYGGKYLQHGWQNYRFDLAMVFDPEFDTFVESELAKVEKYKDDPWLVGYFTDNEIPWVNDALDRHLTLLAHDEPGYLAAREWFDERKGKGAKVEEITPEDRQAFNAFCLETYLSKVTAALRRHDTNHLYLGCRFNQWKEELHSREMFEVAGRYMDVISINHYQRWKPDPEEIANFGRWSGRPFMVTEFYTKGEDSLLPNTSGAGWNVHTQQDRGFFYQNFCLELLKSKCCVGWHWFKYMDNDPEDMHTDPSNRDSNKGMVKWNFEPYPELLELMHQFNDRTYRLIQYIDE